MSHSRRRTAVYGGTFQLPEKPTLLLMSDFVPQSNPVCWQRSTMEPWRRRSAPPGSCQAGLSPAPSRPTASCHCAPGQHRHTPPLYRVAEGLSPSTGGTRDILVSEGHGVHTGEPLPPGFRRFLLTPAGNPPEARIRLAIAHGLIGKTDLATDLLALEISHESDIAAAVSAVAQALESFPNSRSSRCTPAGPPRKRDPEFARAYYDMGVPRRPRRGVLPRHVESPDSESRSPSILARPAIASALPRT